MRDVDYERQRQDRAAAVADLAKRRAAAAAAAAAASGGSGKECSGQECSDAWGQLGIGDQVLPPSPTPSHTTSDPHPTLCVSDLDQGPATPKISSRWGC